MVLALLFLGILITTAGIRGTYADLAKQFGSDMTGQDGFLVWLVALVILGAIGFIPGFQKPTRWLVALVLVVVLLRNNGVFTNLIDSVVQADQSGPATPPQIAPAPGTTAAGGAGGGGGGGSQALAEAGSAVSSLASLAALAVLI